MRGLRTKVDAVYTFFPNIDADIACLTESWLKHDICNSELFNLVNYDVFRKDRDFDSVGRSTGGGVVTIADRDLCALSFDSVVIDSVKLIDVNICKFYVGSCLLYLVNIYVPPDLPSDDYEMFFDTLTLDLLDKKLLICGDFNCPKFYSQDAIDHKTNTLLNFMHALDLKQHNEVLNCNGNLLDLIFSNVSYSILVSHDNNPLVPEDAYHPALNVYIDLIVTDTPENFRSNDNVRFSFRHANFPALYSDLLEIDW